jgi:hypothetical protein
MIVNWTKMGLKVIPTSTTGPSQSLILLPGNNFVPDEVWMKVRETVKDSIKAGTIKEIAAKVEVKKVKEKVPDPKDPEKEIEVEKEEVKISAKDLNDLSTEEAEKVIADTYNLETLEGWKKKAKDSIVPVIREQIENIKKHGEGKKDK